MAPAQVVEAKDLPPELLARRAGARAVAGRGRRRARRLPTPRAGSAAAVGRAAGRGAGRRPAATGWATSSARRARLLDAGAPEVWDTLTRQFEAQLIHDRARHARAAAASRPRRSWASAATPSRARSRNSGSTTEPRRASGRRAARGGCSQAGMRDLGRVNCQRPSSWTATFGDAGRARNAVRRRRGALRSYWCCRCCRHSPPRSPWTMASGRRQRATARRRASHRWHRSMPATSRA